MPQVHPVFHRKFAFQTVEIEEGGELLRAVQPLEFMPGLNLEGFPNRDSTKYKQLYNIENAKTIIRGTIRYKVRPCPTLLLLDCDFQWRSGQDAFFSAV